MCSNDDIIYMCMYVHLSHSCKSNIPLFFFRHSWMLQSEVQLKNGLISSGVTSNIPNLKEQKETFIMLLQRGRGRECDLNRFLSCFSSTPFGYVHSGSIPFSAKNQFQWFGHVLQLCVIMGQENVTLEHIVTQLFRKLQVE